MFLKHTQIAADRVSGPTGTGCFLAQTLGSTDPDTSVYHSSRHVCNLSGSHVDTATSTATHYYTLYWKSKLGSETSGIVKYLNRPHTLDGIKAPLPASTLTAEEVYRTAA